MLNYLITIELATLKKKLWKTNTFVKINEQWIINNIK